MIGDRQYESNLIIKDRDRIGLTVSRELTSLSTNFRRCDLKEINLIKEIYRYTAIRYNPWNDAEMIYLPDIITGENSVIAAGAVITIFCDGVVSHFG